MFAQVFYFVPKFLVKLAYVVFNFCLFKSYVFLQLYLKKINVDCNYNQCIFICFRFDTCRRHWTRRVSTKSRISKQILDYVKTMSIKTLQRSTNYVQKGTTYSIVNNNKPTDFFFNSTLLLLSNLM